LAAIAQEQASDLPPDAERIFQNPETNGAASDIRSESPVPLEVPVEEQISVQQNGTAPDEMAQADLSQREPEPVGWISNGNAAGHADERTVEDAAREATVESIDVLRNGELPAEHDTAPAAEPEVAEPHADVTADDRWSHERYAREPEPAYRPEPAYQPEPPVLAPAARAEAPVIAREDRTYVEEAPPAPAATAQRPPRTRFRDRFKLQLSLIAIIPILLGALIPGVYAYLSPEVYAARSEIVLNISSLEWSAAERFRATQLVVVKARSTLAPIAASVNVPLRDLEKNLEATMVGSSDVIGIQYANQDPAIALKVVEAVTAQYLTDLRDYEQLRNGRHRILLTPTVLDDPVSLTPLRAAMIGAIVGLVIAIAGIALRTQLRPIK
jgi:capsular polysaccharide biosynthesis protein